MNLARLREFKELYQEGKRRKLPKDLDRYLGLLSVLILAWHAWEAVFVIPDDLPFRAASLGMFLAIMFILYSPKSTGDDGVPTWWDWTLVFLSFVVTAYIVINQDRFITRYAFQDVIYPLDVVFGIVTALLVMEGSRRVVGYILPLIAIIALIYPFVGQYIPGIFGHRGFDLDRVVETLYITTSGIFGEPYGIACTFALMFVAFGAFLQLSGGSEFFFKVAVKFAGTSRGGLAKACVLTSAFFSAISGSPVANAASTGSITIPIMKRGGYKPLMAAAIETAASAGGPITPPVMGAVAFLMAEIIGVPYIQVCIAAAIPAIIYFASIFMQVDSEALRHDLRGVSKDEVPPWRELGIGFLQFFGPVVWMVWRLFDNYSPARVALETIVFVMIITLIRRRGRIKLQEIVDACYNSIKTNFVVAAGAAAGGMIVGIIALTGVGAKFSALILSMAGNNMFFALFLTAVVAILLGLAMNITPSYILVAALAGPALIKGGIAPMSAHLFMVYYAVTASISPPVAMTAFTAATIAGADPMATGWRGFRLAIAAYIVPFCFVYRPALINFANFDLFATAEAVVLSVAALYALISALDKTLTGGKLLARLLLGIAFVTLMIPDNYLLSAVGLVILAGVWYWDYLWRKAGNSIRISESF